MTNPSACDLDYVQIAIFATYQRLRLRIWEWPEQLRRRVLLAALDADGRGVEQIARAAIIEAAAVVEEQQRCT